MFVIVEWKWRYTVMDSWILYVRARQMLYLTRTDVFERSIFWISDKRWNVRLCQTDDELIHSICSGDSTMCIVQPSLPLSLLISLRISNIELMLNANGIEIKQKKIHWKTKKKTHENGNKNWVKFPISIIISSIKIRTKYTTCTKYAIFHSKIWFRVVCSRE